MKAAFASSETIFLRLPLTFHSYSPCCLCMRSCLLLHYHSQFYFVTFYWLRYQ